jgi:nucleoside phosphorylase
MKFEDSSQILAKANADGLRRILIVTALPSEMAAVRKHTKHIGSCQGRDGNVFELGHFAGTGSQWLVVVGESGAGNHPSQGVVTNACIQFGPFELILFVGVAATRKVDDAPIGSVVVSNHVYLASVGKYKEGDFFSRSREFPTNPLLLGFSKKVVRDEKWHERLKPPYAGLMPENDNYPKPFPPVALVAPIVSTEAVSADVDSVLERQITAAYQDATALEMEGYGILFAAFNEGIPSIVIRGSRFHREGSCSQVEIGAGRYAYRDCCDSSRIS